MVATSSFDPQASSSHQVPQAYSPVGPRKSSSPHASGKDKACLKTFMKLQDILCPCCDEAQKVAKSKLRTKSGFSKVKCKNCKEIRPSAAWRCRCRKLWIKCPMHLHQRVTAVKRRKHIPSTKEKLLAKYGIDRPLPKLRKPMLKGAGENAKKSSQNEAVAGRAHCERVHVIRPGTRYALMFPHLVKNCAPT